MKILGQRLSDGSVEIFEAPSPALPEGWVRVVTLFSAISPGTEGGKVLAGRMSLLEKARSRPEQARQVLDMARTMGLGDTIRKVRAKLEGAQPLGYSLSGRIVETGGAIEGLEPGTLVACAGGGYANHADEVVVPRNLVCRVPEGVPADRAAYATLGAVALQGARLARPEIGDRAVVIGLGVIGCLAGQILSGAGCTVFGLDISKEALELALSAGAVACGAAADDDRAEAACLAFTEGRGADLVLVCAGSTDSSAVAAAGRLARRKGRVVVVGAVGMNLPREDYYRKELSFSVSCSYGPGRYDPEYEEGGLDYPYPYVRWTEGRNLEAVLGLMRTGRVDPSKLTTHRMPFGKAPSAYSMIASKSEHYCGILLEYPEGGFRPARRVLLPAAARRSEGTHGISLLGSGSFAQSFLLPALSRVRGVRLEAICTRSGLTASDTGKRLGFRAAVSSLEDVLSDPGTDAVVIAARHDLHGPSVLMCLEAGKSVFVEKPLCITMDELKAIAGALLRLGSDAPVLQVGFNRRFSKAAALLKKHFGEDAAPLQMLYRVNAGRIPLDHWIQDPRQGGGRIVGEACHFIDLMQFIAGADPVEVTAVAADLRDRSSPVQDSSSILVRFSNGSTGVLCYVSTGAKAVAKERLEVHGSGRSAVLDNFSRVELAAGRSRRIARAPGRGFEEELAAFVGSLATGVPAIPPASVVATTMATFRILESLERRVPMPVETASLLSEEM